MNRALCHFQLAEIDFESFIPLKGDLPVLVSDVSDNGVQSRVTRHKTCAMMSYIPNFLTNIRKMT